MRRDSLFLCSLFWGLTACNFLPDDVKQAAQGAAQGRFGPDYKGCRAEVPPNVKAIKEAQLIYESENDEFLSVTPHPRLSPSGMEPVPWTTTNTMFNKLNWHPDGNVRGVYSVSTRPYSSANPGGDFEVTGRTDCDGDGVEAVFTATKSLNVKRITPDDVY